MITAVGVSALAVAVIAGLAAVFSTDGDPHALTGDFIVVRYHVADNASLLLLWGAVVGLIALVVLGRLVIDAKRAKHRELEQAHDPAASSISPRAAAASK
ncbi:hypothetical protein JMUB6875_29190 [Nocardia sp. JMUB6875]|uniref:hypothetical protein n=1 Tax=Nocardia sp. JMUB6875 TaxID=3158170 RepID=UPI0032E57925